MICNNEEKYVHMGKGVCKISLSDIALDAFSRGIEALFLAQRIEECLFSPHSMDGTTANEPRCLRDTMRQHTEVCASIVDTLRRIVEQLEGS